MIVNDVTGKKTIDTQSGVWLTNVQTEKPGASVCIRDLRRHEKPLVLDNSNIVENELGGMDI